MPSSAVFEAPIHQVSRVFRGGGDIKEVVRPPSEHGRPQGVVRDRNRANAPGEVGREEAVCEDHRFSLELGSGQDPFRKADQGPQVDLLRWRERGKVLKDVVSIVARIIDPGADQSGPAVQARNAIAAVVDACATTTPWYTASVRARDGAKGCVAKIRREASQHVRLALEKGGVPRYGHRRGRLPQGSREGLLGNEGVRFGYSGCRAASVESER